MKRFVKLCPSLLVVTLLVVFTLQGSALAAYSPPNIDGSAYNSKNIFTQSGYKGQCTWFVWGRTLEKLGIKLNSQFYGNAKTWWTNNSTYKSGQEPRGNSIAVFRNGTAGHVVFVEYVQNGTIYYNEANHHNPRHYDGALESASISSFKNRAGAGNFCGFIYLTNGGGDDGGNPGHFSYANNAQVSGDSFDIRDSEGNVIQGHHVDNGDKITVLDVSYSKQLVYVEYPTPTGVRSGYIKNIPSMIKYTYANQWQNGSTEETVYDEDGTKLGSLNPHEKATPIFKSKKNGMLHVVYNTDKGANTKSGYVKYNGGFTKF